MAENKTETNRADGQAGEQTKTATQAQSQPKSQPQKSSPIPDFTSPEAILIGFFAVILDLIGYVLLFVALDDFWLTDIAGVLIIGSWVFVRGGGMGGQKSGMPGLRNFGIATVIEAIPYIGDLSPSWTIMVWKELKRKN